MCGRTTVSAVTVLKIGLTLRWTKTRNWTNSLEALMRNYSGFYINGAESEGPTTRELVNVTYLSVQIMNPFSVWCSSFILGTFRIERTNNRMC
jgi:hypothetical protein